jgi:ABC-type molybdate transport system substrate-binding protein
LPADVFASANSGLPWQLRRKGLVTRPVVFTSNKLVIVMAHGNPLQLHNVHDL